MGKPTGDAFYPLADVPDIQKEFLRQLEEEAAKKSKEEFQDNNNKDDIGQIAQDMNQVSLVGDGTVALEDRKQLTLPAREKPERSIRLMKEQGMLRKY